MIKITAQIKKYFDNLPKVNELFFAPDGLPFYTEANGNNHAGNLNKKDKKKYPGVACERVTRDEVNAWAADVNLTPALSGNGEGGAADAQGQLDAAKAGLADAENALSAAQANQNTVNGNTASTAAQKTAATKAVTKATAAVTDAQNAVAAAQKVVDALPAIKS